MIIGCFAALLGRRGKSSSPESNDKSGHLYTLAIYRTHRRSKLVPSFLMSHLSGLWQALVHQPATFPEWYVPDVGNVHQRSYEDRGPVRTPLSKASTRDSASGGTPHTPWGHIRYFTNSECFFMLNKPKMQQSLFDVERVEFLAIPCSNQTNDKLELQTY